MYMDSGFYYSEYGGTEDVLHPDKFDLFLVKATRILDYYTFNRIIDYYTINGELLIHDNIKYALCELMDLLNKEDNTSDGIIESETVGSYSVKYASNNDSKSTAKKQRDILNMWLPSELLYRGVRGGRYVY